jgi:hypothetical protein
MWFQFGKFNNVLFGFYLIFLFYILEKSIMLFIVALNVYFMFMGILLRDFETRLQALGWKQSLNP